LPGAAHTAAGRFQGENLARERSAAINITTNSLTEHENFMQGSTVSDAFTHQTLKVNPRGKALQSDSTVILQKASHPV
jgi:hypothetical protein